ncbi:MAG: ArsR family transcriptional regulator [Methanomassiliicoccales archaeon]|nr:MAG: ArsR family transcriptional regulator [Methanomassiliicoccales archaeon]
MNRIKVVNEVADLVPFLRAVSTKVKMEVFKEVSEDWRTGKEITDKYGEEGKNALKLFEKMKLVETRWQPTDSDPGSAPEKAYHTYYSSFSINSSCPVTEISDVLAVAVMSEREFRKYEKEIYESVGSDGKFVGDIAEELKLSPTMLKSLIKRSAKLEYRGHRVERLEAE